MTLRVLTSLVILSCVGCGDPGPIRGSSESASTFPNDAASTKRQSALSESTKSDPSSSASVHGAVPLPQNCKEALSYVLEVFNGTHTIPANGAEVQKRLRIEGSKLIFVTTVGQGGLSVTEEQSCELKYLDGSRVVDAGAGAINVWTKGEKRRVNVSSLRKKCWAMSLRFDKTKYPVAQVIAALEIVILQCDGEGDGL